MLHTWVIVVLFSLFVGCGLRPVCGCVAGFIVGRLCFGVVLVFVCGACVCGWRGYLCVARVFERGAGVCVRRGCLCAARVFVFGVGVSVRRGSLCAARVFVCGSCLFALRGSVFSGLALFGGVVFTIRCCVLWTSELFISYYCV